MSFWKISYEVGRWASFVLIGLVMTVVAFIARPVYGHILAYQLLTGREKMGSLDTWDDLALREKYGMRRREVRGAVEQSLLALLLASWWLVIISWVLSAFGNEAAAGEVAWVAFWAFVVISPPYLVVVVLGWNDFKAIRAMNAEYLTVHEGEPMNEPHPSL